MAATGRRGKIGIGRRTVLGGALSVALAAVDRCASRGQGEERPGESPPVVRLPRSQARLASGKRLTVVCLGDSVTGVYYHTGGRRAYSDMLAPAVRQFFPQADLVAVNAGVSGDTARNGLDRLDRDVLAKRPDLVTVMFGLNDLTRRSKADYEADLRATVERCRAAGAELLLCTPNGVIDTPDRPATRLAEYCETMRSVGTSLQVPVADCHAAYEALRRRSPREWRLLLSDAIHPNMDGHKLMAIEIARAVTGRQANLESVGPPADPLRHCRALAAERRRVKIVAMTPSDRRLKAVWADVAPASEVDWTAWPADGKSLDEIARFASGVRALKPDLVWIAVPAAATEAAGPPESETAIARTSAILNGALSFGRQEWDVVAVAPDVEQPDAAPAQVEFARRLVAAQDLTMIRRPAEETGPAETVLRKWLAQALIAPPVDP